MKPKLVLRACKLEASATARCKKKVLKKTATIAISCAETRHQRLPVEPQKCRKEKQEGKLGPGTQAQRILGTPWEECGGAAVTINVPEPQLMGAVRTMPFDADSKSHLWSVYLIEERRVLERGQKN